MTAASAPTLQRVVTAEGSAGPRPERAGAGAEPGPRCRGRPRVPPPPRPAGRGPTRAAPPSSAARASQVEEDRRRHDRHPKPRDRKAAPRPAKPCPSRRRPHRDRRPSPPTAPPRPRSRPCERGQRVGLARAGPAAPHVDGGDGRRVGQHHRGAGHERAVLGLPTAMPGTSVIALRGPAAPARRRSRRDRPRRAPGLSPRLARGRAACEDTQSTMGRGSMSGPLSGLRVLEFRGDRPGALRGDAAGRPRRRRAADHAARGRPRAADRRHGRGGAARGRPSLALDLKTVAGRDTALRLLSRAEAAIEGLRPARWSASASGPRRRWRPTRRSFTCPHRMGARRGRSPATAGHDINYIALAGVLGALGPPGAPPPPPLTWSATSGAAGSGARSGWFGRAGGAVDGAGPRDRRAMLDGAASQMAMCWACAPRGSGRTVAARTSWTGAPLLPLLRLRLRRPVAWGRSSPGSSRRSSAASGWRARGGTRPTARWPALAARLAEVFAPTRAPTGRRCSRGPTPA